ncbi:MAG: VOC family protein [Blastocatellia bacterium]|nr:VOC family protein [Blastocatellia bacterium]
MKAKVEPIPSGHHTVTPRLFIRGAAKAIEFYKQAFGAIEAKRFADPSGKIVSAEIKIGDSIISLTDEAPEWGNHSPQSLGGATAIITLNVVDADAIWNQAVSAGAKIVFPIADQFYGYRQGRLEDPFGLLWVISTHLEDVSAEEMNRRMEDWMKQQSEKGQ